MKTLGLVVLALLALCGAAKAQDDAEQVSCRVHVVNNTASPDSNTWGHVRSSLKVLAAADIKDVSVILQVQHPDVAALEVTLTAAGTSKNSSSVVIKSAAPGASAGANMVQTIFSDYAPSPLPTTADEAPYSSVYRPAQPLATLASGEGTAAGAGGSQGVWTLAVTDTAAAKRPLKLTGWELWLCGASNGPLFASDMNATAFDGSEVKPELSIIKKRVALPSKTDVAAVIKSSKRIVGAKHDAAAKVMDDINDFLARQLSKKFEPLQALLDKASPALSKVLQGEIANSVTSLQGLPAVMGFQETEDGTWQLPTSEEDIREFLSTLERCYSDLYWCYQETGLPGGFAQDFIATWQSRAQPVAQTWAAAQEQWLAALTNFEENNPQFAAWGDVLFYSAVGTLYRAAQLDAVASVAEAWGDTAIRLALYLSPLRFAVNPRAFLVQAVSGVVSALRGLFRAFAYVNQLTDADNNNDVAAITGFVQTLAGVARQTASLLTLGVRTRMEGAQQALASRAGGLVNGAAAMNEQIASTLGAIDPRLGAMYNSSTDEINTVLRDIGAAQQDAVARYLRSSTNRLDLGGKLDETFTLVGEAVAQLAANTATALKSAQEALDSVLPGPSLQQVLIDLRSTIEGILSDARETLDATLPIPELMEMEDLLRATVQATLDLLDNAATQVTEGEGSQAIQAQLNNLAAGLSQASSGVQTVVESIQQGFPGPMLQSTLDGIRQQGARTATNIDRLFQSLARDYPNLDPATFIKELGSLLDSLATNTLDLTSAFENLAGFDAARQLGEALPATVEPVVQAVQAAAKDLPALATANPGAKGADQLTQLQKNIGSTLETFAGQISSIAKALPNQPPVPAVADRLTSRTQDLGEESNALADAIRNLVGAPAQVAEAALTDFNSRLSNLVDDLRGQNAQAARLGEVLTSGPLGEVVQGLANLLEPINSGFEALTSTLPSLPEIRQLLDNTLAPPLEALGLITRQAGQAAIAATEAVNRGALQGLAGILQQLVVLLNQGQLQIAALLNGAGQVASQLQALAPPEVAAEAVRAPLAGLDAALAGTIGTIAQGLEDALTSLAPPELVVGLVQPLAAGLNQGLGGLLAALNATANGGPPAGLPALLEGATGVFSNLAATAATALGLPPPPGLARPAGRNLLQIAPVTDIPAGFDVTAFNGAVGNALLGAATQFANAAIAAVNGRPGASASLSALQKFLTSLQAGSGVIESLLGALPQGNVLSVILDPEGGQKVIQSLQGLQAGLKSATGAEAGPIMGEIAKLLGSLTEGATVGAGPAVQAALQAASKLVMPNAGGLLSGFLSQLAAAMGGGN